MVGTGRKKSIAFFIALGAGLILVIILLYVGWVLLNWHRGILLFLGVLLLALIIAGVVLDTTFLVREIRRNEQHDAFINAVTHELKTPVASIRLYVETLQTRAVDEARRNEFYSIILSDSDRLLGSMSSSPNGARRLVEPETASGSAESDRGCDGVRGARAHFASRGARVDGIRARASAADPGGLRRGAGSGLEPDR